MRPGSFTSSMLQVGRKVARLVARVHRNRLVDTLEEQFIATRRKPTVLGSTGPNFGELATDVESCPVGVGGGILLEQWTASFDHFEAASGQWSCVGASRL
jgi:hypothetical protein